MFNFHLTNSASYKASHLFASFSLYSLCLRHYSLQIKTVFFLTLPIIKIYKHFENIKKNTAFRRKEINTVLQGKSVSGPRLDSI